jgi:protein TonB
VTTPPNPEHLLRRPKKQQPKQSSTGKIAIAAGAAILVAAGVVGYIATNHGKSAAGNAALSVAQAAAPIEQTDVPVYAPPPLKHAATKQFALPKPRPGAAATPAPAPTPNPTVTPVDTRGKTATEIAKAKHAAALRLAALRRAQAVTRPATGTSALSNAAETVASVPSQPANAVSQPVPTQAATATPAVATPDAEATPVYAPRVVVDARFLERVAPVYPDIAREQGAQGTAIVMATVGPKGNVLSVDIDQSTGNKLLDSAALAAARESRFEPPEIDGKPATETYRIVYTFDLNQ